eukprot:970421-Prorocentrum_minimum.AAC.3
MNSISRHRSSIALPGSNGIYRERVVPVINLLSVVSAALLDRIAQLSHPSPPTLLNSSESVGCEHACQVPCQLVFRDPRRGHVTPRGTPLRPPIPSNQRLGIGGLRGGPTGV